MNKTIALLKARTSSRINMNHLINQSIEANNKRLNGGKDEAVNLMVEMLGSNKANYNKDLAREYIAGIDPCNEALSESTILIKNEYEE